MLWATPSSSPGFFVFLGRQMSSRPSGFHSLVFADKSQALPITQVGESWV